MRSGQWTACGALVVAAAIAGQGCSSSDERTVSGRTRSLASAVDSSTALQGRLRFTTRREQATGATAARFDARLVVDRAEAAVVRLPGGDELTLTAAGRTFEARLEGGPAELAARCPPGSYTFLARTGDGAHASLTLVATGAPPAPPAITAPLDLSLVPDGALRVTWTWEGTAGLFDVTLEDAQGEVAYLANDLAGREHTIPRAWVRPGRFRLIVTAATAESDADVRFEAGAAVLVDVAP